MAWLLLMVMSSVWPSLLALAASCVPMLPPAPGRFSTTTEAPSTSLSFWLTTRPTMSLVPPAACGTIMTIGRLGQVD